MTPKQERFVQEYLIDLNATRAAIASGYSAKTAEAAGSRLLRNVKVAEQIRAAQAELAATARVTSEMVVEELRKIGFCDIRKAVRWGRSPIDTESENANPTALGIYPVELVPSELIDDDTAAAVAEVSLTQTGVKLKMHDKRAALVDLGKHLGLFTDKVEHSGGVHVTINKP